MFINEISELVDLKEASTRFKEKIRDKALIYLSPIFQINFPEHLKYEQISIISWLLAICLRYKNYSEIEWDSSELYKQAQSINRLLFSDLLAQIYIPLLRQLGDENKSTFDLTSLQQEKFLKTLNKSGLLQDKYLCYDFEGNKCFNFGYIDKNLLFKIINRRPSLANCFSNEKNDKKLTTDDCLPHFCKRKDAVADLIYTTTKQFLLDNGCCPTPIQIWNIIKTKPPQGFDVESVNDFLIVDGTNKVSRELFMKRITRYTTKKDI